MSRLHQLLPDLWNGRVELGRVFWEYAIAYGTIFNLIATLASLAAFAGDWPDAIALAIFFLPAPYNLLMIISVWRSAARYAGPAIWATFARALIVVWAAVVTFI
jgi:hypothetical protein